MREREDPPAGRRPDRVELWSFAAEREARKRMSDETLRNWVRPGRLARLAGFIRRITKGK